VKQNLPESKKAKQTIRQLITKCLINGRCIKLKNKQD